MEDKLTETTSYMSKINGTTTADNRTETSGYLSVINGTTTADNRTETSGYLSVINGTTAADNSTEIIYDYIVGASYVGGNEAMLRMGTIFSAKILFSGLFGNVMILLILGRLKSSGSSLDVFFMALAVSDSCFLLTFALKIGLQTSFDIDFYATHSVVCKTCTWLINASAVLSSWLLVAMTVQKALSIVWPHRVRVLCTRKRSKLLLWGLVMFVMFLHAHFLFGVDVQTLPPGGKHCVVHLDYGQVFVGIWSWIHLLLTSLLPFLFLVASNSILIWKLASAVRNNRMALSSVQSDQAATRRNRVSSVTITLIVVSLTFLLLSMPNSMFILLQKTLERAIKNDADARRFMFVYVLFQLLWCSNSSVNFYLYCLTGSLFRNEFKNIMCSCQGDRMAQRTAGPSCTQTPVTRSRNVERDDDKSDEM